MQIVALKPDGNLVALEKEPFDLEVTLQDLLAEYPSLMLSTGADYQERQIWTIGYEVATDAGSIDLLMLDSVGEVWVAEAKLRKNPEVKKQVVGQVLGYASCVAEWSIDKLGETAHSYLGQPLSEFLAEKVGGSEEADLLIRRAAEKLRQGDLTALIVVDELPRVLQRVVEFVNDHSAFDILAMQLEVVEHEGTRFVVPTVTGASVSKSVSPTGGSEATYPELLDVASDEFKEMVERLDEWAAVRGYQAVIAEKSRKYNTAEGIFVLRLYPQWDAIQMWIGSLYEAGMEAQALDLRDRLGRISGDKIPAKEVGLKARLVLEKWDEVVEFLAVYVGALEAAH